MLFKWDEFSPADSEAVLWDAVIVGAGMGGGTLGYALARKGLKVLFLERGSAQTLFPQSLGEGRLKRMLGLERPEDRMVSPCGLAGHGGARFRNRSRRRPNVRPIWRAVLTDVPA